MTKFVEHRSQKRTATKPIVVLYHAECTDGFGAAWSAWKHFGDAAEYVAVEHQSPLPDGLTDKEVYTLDFTYPADVTKKLTEQNKRLTSIDHHVSVADVTRSTQDGLYDTNHSGAMLAWQYFHPDKPVPFLLRVIEDYDLYRFNLAETRDLHDWMELYDFRFTTFDELATTLEDSSGKAAALEKGALLRQYREKEVERLLANTSVEVSIQGHRAGAVNTELYHGECANALAETYGVGIAWRVRPHGTYVSLRSSGGVNVAEVAGVYGGGGHAKSAGFMVSSPQDLPFNIVTEQVKKHE